jgi:GWxTD domain-containing protein
MRKYFLRFWTRRDPLTPEKAWVDYKAQVDKADKEFKTPIRKGYETDRGRVYLQYGQPNSADRVDHEPSSYPYEIWHYYNLGSQSNAKFIFYNPSLVANDYELLHSTVIGEPYDPAWHYKLHKRDTQLNDINTKGSQWHYGSRSRDLFDIPR